MSWDPSPRPADLPSGENARLHECLAEYLEAEHPAERSAREPFLADHPDQAADLADYFDAVAVVEQIAAPLRELARQHFPVEPPSSPPGYELLEEIGRGGTAVVYRARQQGLNRLVAIKMIRPDRASSACDLQRFRFEAETVASLNHPGIVPVFETGLHGGTAYFSMKLYEGGSLSARLHEFTADPQRGAELAEQIARAVHHAHQRGILHRDLKPSNILLDELGQPHVADFGLAKRLEPDQQLTQTGELIGTPFYIPPERIAGSPWAAPATTAADVYGLGAILYTLLTGRPPFRGETWVETMLTILRDDPPAPSSLNTRIDRDLETICRTCLEKDPSRRYGSALAVAEDLRRWRSGEPIAARPIGTFEQLRRWCGRHPVRATAALAATLLAALGILGLLTGYVLVSRANGVAQRHQASAEHKAAELRLRLYASQMSLAFRYRQRGELDELRTLLDQFRDDRDLIGFEWRWLDREARARPRELARLVGHQHILYGGAFSPDGRTIATCGADATVRLWDAATGKLRQTLHTNSGVSASGEKLDENCVQFSPDGSLLASACEDGSVRLWDLAAGTHERLLPAPGGETLSVDFSPDGCWLLTASLDGYVRVWDVAARELHNEFYKDTLPPKCAVFSPDGRSVAAIGGDGQLLVRDRASGEITLELQTSANNYCLAYSPDGTLLATESAGLNVALWNSATGERVAVFPASASVRSLEFSPDGRLLASASDDGRVRICELTHGEGERFFKAHSATAWGVKFAPDGRSFLTVGGDWTARVWKRNPPAAASPLAGFNLPVRQLTFSPHGRVLAASTSDYELHVGDPARLETWQRISVAARTHAPPAFSPGGHELAFIGAEGEINRWSLMENRMRAAFQPPELPSGSIDWKLSATQLAWLDDNRLAALTSRSSLLLGDSHAWRTCRDEPRIDADARFLASLAGGRRLVLSVWNSPAVEIWNVEQNRVTRHFDLAGHVFVAALSPEETWLACGKSDGTIEVIPLGGAGKRKHLVGHRLGISGLAFSADGKTLASGSEDGTARLWNVATGLELFTIESRPQQALCVAFSADGSLLAIGGNRPSTTPNLTIHQTNPD